MLGSKRSFFIRPLRCCAAVLALITLFLSVGCSPPSTPTADDQPETEALAAKPAPMPTAAAPEPKPAPAVPQVFELSAEKLLAARLPDEQARQGWVRLFDTQTLFGWQMTGAANWRVEGDTIVVDGGEKSFLATASQWQDYELELQFKADAETNSGVFLRTPLSPQAPQSDCYELNIAPPSNPFPTGSLVQRQRVDEEPIESLTADEWHTFNIRVEGNMIRVRLNESLVCEYEDPMPLPAGHVSLQHNSGRVAFRDIRIRPIGLQSLLGENDLAKWKQYPEFDGKFELDADGVLQVTGGSGQLESRQTFGDFALHARCRTNAADLNSGIFFRCIPGEKMNGYECQISNETVDGDPLNPGDAGTGGIFRRQPARIVAAEDEQWFNLLLVANGPTMMAWVNGLQVSDWTDLREPDPNPRRGLRLEPGTLMIQAHDPTTDLSFSDIAVAAIGAESIQAEKQDPSDDDSQ